MDDEHNNFPENGNNDIKPRGFSSKKNIIFIILVAVLTFGIGGAAIVAGVSNAPENRLSRYMRAAERYLSEMNYERAVIEYQRVLEIDPMNVDAILGLADAYIGMGDMEKAIETLRDGLERTGDMRIQVGVDEMTKEEELSVSSEPEDSSSEKVVFSVQNKGGKPLKDVQITVETSYANDGNQWEQREEWITDAKGEVTGELPDGEYIITYTYGEQKKSENVTIKGRDRELSIIMSDEDIGGDSSNVSEGLEDTDGMEIASGISGDNFKQNESEGSEDSQELPVLSGKVEKTKDEEVTALIAKVYRAYVGNDVRALEESYSVLSANEKSYIEAFSDYKEEYRNVECYVLKLNENEYFVSPCYELKFYNVDTPAPGMDFFYLQRDDEGRLYVNSAYTTYNFHFKEQDLDAGIYCQILAYDKNLAVAELKLDVQSRYEAVVAGDEKLANLIRGTLRTVMTNWQNSISGSND